MIGLRRWFGLEQRPHDKYTRIIVVEARGTVLGFIVDSGFRSAAHPEQYGRAAAAHR